MTDDSYNTTIWIVCQDYGELPQLISAQAKVTAKQARLARYSLAFQGQCVPLGRFYLTPEDAIAAWHAQREAEVAAAIEKLDAARARQAMPIEGVPDEAT